MHGRLQRLALVAAGALPLMAVPQDFACDNADACTQALMMGVEGSLERMIALAEGGDAAAQAKLGLYYLGEWNTPSQPGGDSWLQGTKWLRMAATQGSPEALYHLAGTLMETDRIRFYRFAAEQGHALAQLKLAFFYLGEGDLVQYRKWFQLGIEGQTEPFRISGPIEAKDLKLTSAQIAEGDRLAREWKPKTWAELLVVGIKP